MGLNQNNNKILGKIKNNTYLCNPFVDYPIQRRLKIYITINYN